jgi:hypothetical protein
LFEKYGLEALILANDSPQGISKNFNRLAAAATSPLIAPLPPDERDAPDAAHGEMMRAFSAMALDRGNVAEAATLLAKAMRLSPWRTENLRTLWYLARTAAKQAVRR